MLLFATYFGGVELDQNGEICVFSIFLMAHGEHRGSVLKLIADNIRPRLHHTAGKGMSRL